jgi:hypothetical protein
MDQVQWITISSSAGRGYDARQLTEVCDLLNFSDPALRSVQLSNQLKGGKK